MQSLLIYEIQSGEIVKSTDCEIIRPNVYKQQTSIAIEYNKMASQPLPSPQFPVTIYNKLVPSRSDQLLAYLVQNTYIRPYIMSSLIL
jgi:hypothetical protein